MGFPKEWRDGDLVTGRYCNAKYTGRIVDHGEFGSRRTPVGNGFIFVVDLCEPIMVFGEERKQIQIWTTSESDTLELFEASHVR